MYWYQCGVGRSLGGCIVGPDRPARQDKRVEITGAMF